MSFLHYCSLHHRALHSFPTRRSSDLIWEASQRFGFDRQAMEVDYLQTGASLQSGENREEVVLIAALQRSEEHTSELQSHHDLVCRLLLEKKKKKKNKKTITK